MNIKNLLGKKQKKAQLSQSAIMSITDLSNISGGAPANFGKHLFCRYPGGEFDKHGDGDCPDK